MIKVVLGEAEMLPALSRKTEEEESSDNIIAHLGLPTGFQVHDMGFDVCISDDPLFGADVHAGAGPSAVLTSAMAHMPSCIAEEEEVLWQNIFAITSDLLPENKMAAKCPLVILTAPCKMCHLAMKLLAA